MKWINEYKKKVKKDKLKGLYILLATIIIFVTMLIAANNSYKNEDLFGAIAVFTVFIGVFCSATFLMCKVVYRKYNNEYICLYVAPVKNYLIINNEVQYEGGPFTRYYYGQLSDGTDVAVKISGFGDVKFAIGSFNNHNISFF